MPLQTQLPKHSMSEPIHIASLSRIPSILVVEEDPSRQWMAARELTSLGYRVIGTSSIEGAESLLQHWRVDLVLLSEVLARRTDDPATGGLDSSREHLPVVLMARDINDADAWDDEVPVQTTTGVVHRIRAPLSREKLERVIGLLMPRIALASPAE